MYKKHLTGTWKHMDFMFLDLIAVQVAFLVAYVLRHGMLNPYTIPVYRDMALFLGVACLSVALLRNSFSGVLRRGYYKEFMAVLVDALCIVMVSSFYLVLIKEAELFSRVVLFLTGGIYLIVSYGLRLWRKRVLKKRKKTDAISLVVVTALSAASELINTVRKDSFGPYRIVGLVLLDDSGDTKSVEGIPVVADTTSLPEFLCREWVDAVMLHLPEGYSISQALMEELKKTGVVIHRSLIQAQDSEGRKQMVNKIGGYTVLTTTMNYATAKEAFSKRLIDIIGGFFGCLLTLVLCIFLAPIIFISSPGPIFFKQERVGLNGKRFKMYKFRSMYPDAEARKKDLMQYNRCKDGMTFKMEFDPRIIGNKVLPNGKRKTGIGEFIRRTSLDEFPQFFNVLKGDMSLVGTRPPTVAEVEKYLTHHRARLAVKPGITGMWQISGRSNITDFEEIVKLDTEYINNWSMGLDLRILLKTFVVVFKKDGSM